MMAHTLLFYVHYALLLLFGILLSAAFAGLRMTRRKNMAVLGALFVFCGLLQLGSYLLFDEETVWKIYPLIAHLPLLLLLCLYYRRRFVTALTAVTAAYMCCQPAKWVGELCRALWHNGAASEAMQIAVLLGFGFVTLVYLAPHLAEVFQKDSRSVWIFGSVPMVYYVFDYVMDIYTGLWMEYNPAVAEFLPFILCLAFLLFCFVYYKEYEQMADAERKEQIVRITVEQQTKEIEAIRRSEQEVRLLRHDMRLFLGSLAVCIDDGDKAKAREMIEAYDSHIRETALLRFCESDTINYVLSDYSAKCRSLQVPLQCSVKLEALPDDEFLFSSILSNALDNALNAQLELPDEKRSIKLMLKNSDGKLLLSVKNPYAAKPAFADGLPVTDKKGHGFGTQSIRHAAERLGGNCQFSAQDGLFVLRVIL